MTYNVLSGTLSLYTSTATSLANHITAKVVTAMGVRVGVKAMCIFS